MDKLKIKISFTNVFSLILFIIFAFAGINKLIYNAQFNQILKNSELFRFFPSKILIFMSVVLAFTEITIGIFLLISNFRRLGAILSSILFSSLYFLSYLQL